MAEVSTTQRLRVGVAEEVRVMMARRRMNGTSLAAAIGRSQAYVSRRLTGETAFDVDDLERIAAALEVGVATLLPQDANRGTIAQTVRAPKQSRYGAVRTIRMSDVRPPRRIPAPPAPAVRAVRLPVA